VSQVIKPKRRHTSGAPTTSDLEPNEIAINTNDFTIYVRDESNNILRVGGVQTPMNQDLDTDQYEIKSTTSLNSNLGLPDGVKMGSYLKLAHKADVASEFVIDAQYCEVGKRYMISSAGNTDWVAMGAGGNFGTTIFTCTATGTGTGTCFVGDDYFGVLAYDPSTKYVVVYNDYDSDTGSGTARRFGWQRLSKGQFN
jgi:DNA-binding beta-propeller fold protein YncE